MSKIAKRSGIVHDARTCELRRRLRALSTDLQTALDEFDIDFGTAFVRAAEMRGEMNKIRRELAELAAEDGG